jgi:hypothetical protein
MQTEKTHSAAYNSCLIEIEKWEGAAEASGDQDRVVVAE